MAIENTRSYKLTLRLWPEVGQMDEHRQMKAVETIVQLLYLLPFAAAAIILLILRTNFEVVDEHIEALVILFVAMALLMVQPFNVRIQLDKGGQALNISSSLAPLVMWSALFISGATGLWAMILASAAAGLWQGWQLSRYGENALWRPLSQFVRQMGTYVLVTSLAALFYLGVGGEFPITSARPEHWVPAFITLVISALFSAVPMIPAVIQTDNLDGSPVSAGSLLRFYVGAVALPLIMSPFAIIVAMIDTEGETVALIFIIIGIYLVNRLAHHMSRAEDRSRSLARELGQLEKLGEAIIEAPPDASTLPAVLAEHLPRLFPTDRVEIKLFKSEQSRAWSPFDLSQPKGFTSITGEDWQALCQAAETSRLFPKVSLPGQRRVFGDGLMVKIVTEEPGQKVPTCAGGLYLLRHNSVGKSIDSLATAQSLASQIASALNRAETHAEALAFQKAQQELEFAGHIQTSFLPTGVPEAEHWQLSATLESARQTSGDFYDFIPLDDGLIGFIVADVSDKGTGAALYMALSRTLIRTFAMQNGLQPGLALTRANERIMADSHSEQFVTVIYGVLDTATGLLTYANAGHNPGYLLRAADGQTVDKLTPTGIPVGMFEEMEWGQAEIQIDPGDVLLFYSDGVPEAQTIDRVEFGDDRLLSITRARMDRTSAEIQDAIIAAIHDHVGDDPQFDDITLMVVSRSADSS